ncbi:polyphenol oxidase family protein [Candidatus Fermentibacterales bacterium]|nr:polyphenol oxidase family protein [Candidatus Fermentibacterales bacterium]
MALASFALPGTGFALRVAGRNATEPALPDDPPITLLRQVHGCEVLMDPQGGETGDGMVLTDLSRRPGVTVADCLPVLAVTDSAMGVAHAGWRGLAAGVVRNLVSRLPGTPLAVALGPCICASCYTVGTEVLDALGIRPDSPGAGRLDLRECARHRLLLAGVGREIIFDFRDCTMCMPLLYHSYRRDRERAGRNLVWLERV